MRRLCSWIIRCAAVLLCMAVGAAPRIARAQERSFAYRVSWNGIPAARATVKLADPVSATPQLSRLSAEVETNAFVDLLWSFRGFGWGEADAQTLRPLRFTFDRRINGRRELTEVEAEPDGLLTGRYRREDRSRLVEVNDAEVLDPVAGILHALRAPPAAGAPQVYDIFTGEARYRIELHREDTEMISVPAGRFAAIRITPVMWRIDKNAPETRARRVTMWVTEAEPHLLLRVRGEVFIGALYCDLTEIS